MPTPSSLFRDNIQTELFVTGLTLHSIFFRNICSRLEIDVMIPKRKLLISAIHERANMF